jgi:chromate reductase, NAD(P)H dehydrogenase (quinone)
MKENKIRILGISGSLRKSSSASALLRQAGELMPEQVEFKIYEDLEKIPAFDDGRLIVVPVLNFIKQISEADAVFFCIPEYAFGVPGALKNALDWTVSTTVFSGKPVALITAASGGDKAHAAMSLTLTALGTKISENTQLLLSFIRTKLDEKGRLKDEAELQSMINVINALIQTIATTAQAND